MRKEIIGSCPVCEDKLRVTKLECHSCGTTIGGEFKLSKFDYLSEEQQYFIEIFLKNRGNIKEIEKEMKISYPTVRRLLDNVIEGLGYMPEKPVEENIVVSKSAVLERLANGEITSEEAVKLLRGAS